MKKEALKTVKPNPVTVAKEDIVAIKADIDALVKKVEKSSMSQTPLARNLRGISERLQNRLNNL